MTIDLLIAELHIECVLDRDKLHLTLSLADGASARVSAINASLRTYRPSFMHFWQLKT